MKRALMWLPLLAAGLAHAETPDLAPGNYEYTTTTTLTGMPVAVPAQVHRDTQCVTAEDLANAKAKFAEVEKSSEGACKIDNYKSDAKSASWTMTCSAQGFTSTGKGAVQFKGDAYTMKMETDQTGSGISMHATTVLEAQRVGDC